MGLPTLPQPVRLLIALLAAEPQLLASATVRLQQDYGAVDLESNIFPWRTTDYYQAEMGNNLLRRFLTFEPLISPEELVRIKLETNAHELTLSSTASTSAPRRINLDPGYLDATKLVLASTKGQAHRLYLSQGIYAEVTLLYYHKAFHPFLYTYEDYRWPETHAFLTQARKHYLEQLKARRKG